MLCPLWPSLQPVLTSENLIGDKRPEHQQATDDSASTWLFAGTQPRPKHAKHHFEQAEQRDFSCGKLST